MSKLIEIVVKRPVTILMVIVSILILGLISLSRLSIDFMPNMQIPYISIYTSYRNSGPEEIEKSVTKLVEGAVATVNNIKNITSTSRENSSNVLVEFNWGTDLTEATEDIREALEQVVDSMPNRDAVKKALTIAGVGTIITIGISFFTPALVAIIAEFVALCIAYKVYKRNNNYREANNIRGSIDETKEKIIDYVIYDINAWLDKADSWSDQLIESYK